MSETNGKQTEIQPNPEICTLRIMFPVESDQKAIEIKRKIQDVLGDTTDVRIEFGIIQAPMRPPQP